MTFFNLYSGTLFNVLNVGFLEDEYQR